MGEVQPVSVEFPKTSTVLNGPSVGLAWTPVCEGGNLVVIIDIKIFDHNLNSPVLSPLLSFPYKRRYISPLQSRSVSRLPPHPRRSGEASGRETFFLLLDFYFSLNHISFVL